MFSGDKESGKTTLIAKLQGNEDPKKGSGLEYGYIDVRDEYREGEKYKLFFQLLFLILLFYLSHYWKWAIRFQVKTHQLFLQNMSTELYFQF